MENIKMWLIEVAVKKMGPSAIRGAILGFFGWVLARQGVLTSFGIITDATTHTITIHLEQLNIALIAILPAALAAIIKMLNHHADQIITPKQVSPSSIPAQPS